ncbi:MAG: FG-GAP-like repeat-containing protein [Acidobacteriota bacterium]
MKHRSSTTMMMLNVRIDSAAVGSQMPKMYLNINSFLQTIGRSAACFVALLIFTAVAGAATYVVDTNSDNGNLSACTAAANDCSLRGAISKANGTPADDVITFAGSYTIIMTGGALSVSSAATAGALTITNSSGASNLVIDGNYLFGEFGTHLTRVFYIGGGGNLTLNGVTVRNGFSFDAGFPYRGGGGILNDGGTLLLTNSIVSENQSIDNAQTDDVNNYGGGGIFNRPGGSMTLENSTVSGNVGSNAGGGIYNEGTLSLTNSTVSGNSVPDQPRGIEYVFGQLCPGGGGICNQGTLNLTNSTVSNNSIFAPVGGGGGISNNGGIINLKNSAVVNNSAFTGVPNSSGGGGGGISNFRNGTLNLINVTVGNNSVNSSGGGISNYNATVLLIDVTIARNTANDSGGGVSNVGEVAVGLLNTIVAKNSAPAAADFEGPVNGFSQFNLIGDGTGMTGIANGSLGNQIGSAADPIDPKLNTTLALNSGSTLNFALLTGSPAIDKGKRTVDYDMGTDQRGLPRPVDNPTIPNPAGGDGSDIGAFEVQPANAFLSDMTVTKTHGGNFTQGDTGKTYSITVTNSGTGSTNSAVSVTDTLPTGLTATGMSGTGWTCTLATLTCTRSDVLAAAASYPLITLTVNVASNAPASVTNTVSVSGGGETNTANNTASDQTTIQAGGVFDLTVTKTHTGNFTQGDVGRTYTLTVTNIGTGTAFGLSFVQDILPAGLTATAITGTGWTCSLAELSCTGSGNGTLAAGASYPPITVTVNVSPNAPASVINTVSVAGNGEVNKTNNSASDPTTIAAAPVSTVKSRSDFDGDGKTDVSVFRPADGTWYINNSTTGFKAMRFGQSGDIVVPGDYDGDGKADYAVFRASDTAGAPDFFVLNSGSNTVTYLSLGGTGDIPVAGDYDGDGRSDLAVFHPATGNWYIQSSAGGATSQIPFGVNGDQPFTMDNDNDGKSNLAVFRPSDNTWYIARSTGTPAQNFDAVRFGTTGDIPVPADYDGDNKEDIAMFRPSNGNWYILRSSDGQVWYQHFGASGDVPVPGDYDGDGKDDIAVYRNGTWYINRSTSGFAAINFGVASDVPVPSKFHP